MFIFFGGLALFAMLAAGLYALSRHRALEQSLAQGRRCIMSLGELLAIEVREPISDIRYLSHLEEANEVFVSVMDEGHSANFEHFMRDRAIYDQLRYIDRYGMEAFRIDYNEGDPIVQPFGQLQYVGNSPEFASVSALERGELYISALELRIGDDGPEEPFKPILRVGAPLFADGDRRGMIMLNLLGSEVLRLFSSVTLREGERVMLANDNGHWLRGPTAEDEWGFMLEERRGRTVQAMYPGVWEGRGDQQSGVVTTDDGLFFFQALCPAEVLSERTGSPVVSDAGCWWILLHVPEEVVYAESSILLNRLHAFVALAAVALLLGCVFLSKLRMSSLLGRQQVADQHAAYSRFVPREFLQLLGKGNYRDISLETHVEVELTALFSDIRSYTKISESLEAKDVLAFLNAYFEGASDAITGNGGFVDCFHGDALLALFPGRTDDALRAGIAMFAALDEFNKLRAKQGGEAVGIGIGMHMGAVTLGTIGTTDRLQVTVIGDAVNLAARVESATKLYGARIIISQDVLARLEEPGQFSLREIDTVRVKGKNRPVVLHEVFDVDTSELIECKRSTTPLLRKGLELYKRGEFEPALELFEQCREQCPEDGVPGIYIKRCNTMIRIPPGEGWTGISTL